MSYPRYYELYPLTLGLDKMKNVVVSTHDHREPHYPIADSEEQPKDRPGYCHCITMCSGKERLLRTGKLYISHMTKEAHRVMLFNGENAENQPPQQGTMREGPDTLGVGDFGAGGLGDEGPDAGRDAGNDGLIASALQERPSHWNSDLPAIQIWSSPPPPDEDQYDAAIPRVDTPDQERARIDPPNDNDHITPPNSRPSLYQALPYPVAVQHPMLHDFLQQWPTRIPDVIANPAAIIPQSYGFSARVPKSNMSFMDLYLGIHAATLSALQVPRSIVEFSLKTSIRFATLMIDTCRAAAKTSPAQPGSDKEEHPIPDLLQSSVTTVKSVEKRLGLEVPLICHPVCANSDCHEVFYDLLTMEAARKSLPGVCPACESHLRQDGIVDAASVCKWFNRIPLKYELERILAYPGVEEEVFNWKARRDAKVDIENLPEGIKIYSEQFDGAYWKSLLDPNGRPLSDSVEDVIHVNFSIDWFNANHGIHMRAYSMGPMVLELADLPPSLRARQPLLACLGITPGPEEPKAANLWKFTLPLFLELRQAWEHPLILRTPAHPVEGRPVRIALCAIVCDRPAAINTVGGPSQSSPDSVCTRCHATEVGLQTSRYFAFRDSAVHSQSVLYKLKAMPAAIEEAKRAHLAAEEEKTRQTDAIRARWPEIPSQYPGLSIPPRYKPKPFLKKTEKQIIKEFDQYRGSLSATMLLPYVDKFVASTFDVMHNLFLGNYKNYYQRGLVGGAYDETPEEEEDLGTTELADGDGGPPNRQGGTDTEEEMMNGGPTGGANDSDSDGRSESSNDPPQGPSQPIPPGDSSRAQDTQQIPKKRERGRKKTKDDTETKGLLRSHDLAIVTQFMQELVFPTNTNLYRTVPSNFLNPKTGSKTAAQWSSFVSIYVPLLFPLLWHINSQNPLKTKRAGRNPLMTEEELDAIMLQAQINNLAIRPIISDIQLGELRRTIDAYDTAVLSLHPGVRHTKNLHQMQHIPQDIELHGPVAGHWAFRMERLNKKLGDVNTNGKPGERERTALKARYKSTQVSLLHVWLENAAQTPIQRSFTQDIRALLSQCIPQDFKANTSTARAITSICDEVDEIRETRSLGSVYELGVSDNLSAHELFFVKSALKKNYDTRRLPVSIYNESQTLRALHRDFVINPAIIRFRQMRYGQKRFRGFSANRPLPQLKLEDLKDCLFAFKAQSDVLTCRRQTDIRLCAIMTIFSHRLTDHKGNQGPERHFMISSDLVFDPTDDVLHYRKFPNIDLTYWKPDSWQTPRCVVIDDSIASSMRHVAILPARLLGNGGHHRDTWLCSTSTKA